MKPINKLKPMAGDKVDKFVTTYSDDRGLETHAAPNDSSCYHTFCGLDADDYETTGLRLATNEEVRGIKDKGIDCPACIGFINGAKRYRKRDFRNQNEYGQ